MIATISRLERNHLDLKDRQKGSKRDLTQNTQWDSQMFLTKAGPRLLRGKGLEGMIIHSRMFLFDK